MRQAIQSESKSTAGDKHETGRAMIHLEQEKLHKQLAEAQQILAELDQVNAEQGNKVAKKGALVTTNRATFFVGVGLGKVSVSGTDYFVISWQSPIAKQMLGKVVGDSFQMNGTEYVITAIE